MSLKEAAHWLKRARRRAWAALFVVNHMKQEPGESWEHWRNRRKKAIYRYEHREKIKDRLQRKFERLKRKENEKLDADGVTVPDAPWNPQRRPIANWIIPWLKKSWAAGWRGIVYSGYRTPEYSESLCYDMCGAPSCSGTCAGRSSGHSQKDYPGGCVDVSDYNTFESVQFKIGSPLRNALPNDAPHFSVSGR